jgi:hypothetical protein
VRKKEGKRIIGERKREMEMWENEKKGLGFREAESGS